MQGTEGSILIIVWVASGRYGTWSSNKKIKKKFLEKWNKIISYFWKVTAQNKAGSFLMYFLSVFSSFAPACKNVERVPAGSWFISISIFLFVQMINNNPESLSCFWRSNLMSDGCIHLWKSMHNVLTISIWLLATKSTENRYPNFL